MELKYHTYAVYGEKVNYGNFELMSPDQCREWYKNSIMDGTIKISVTEVDEDNAIPSSTALPQELIDIVNSLPVRDLVILLRDAANMGDTMFKELIVSVLKKRTEEIK